MTGLELMWQDVVIAFGSVVGITTKMYALWDSQTVWSRTSSLPNAALYPISLLAFLTLDLWLTFVTTFINMSIWFGIYFFRAPESEDWVGRRNGEPYLSFLNDK